jgi:hypothetical protein
MNGKTRHEARPAQLRGGPFLTHNIVVHKGLGILPYINCGEELP